MSGRYGESTRRDAMRRAAMNAAAARAQGNYRAAELHAATWHRLNRQSDAEHAVAGMAHRVRRAARDRAGELARLPLCERISV